MKLVRLLCWLGFVYVAAQVFGQCASVAQAQSGFQLKAGESVRTSSTVTTDPAAAYGIGQYTFTRCLWAPAAPSSTSYQQFGLITTGAEVPIGIDAGSRWYGTNRLPINTQTSGATTNALSASNRFAWQGWSDGGLGGFTVWIRYGHEVLSDAGMSWAGVAYQTGNAGCTGDGWGTASADRPVGILVRCPWDGGSTDLCNYTDAGVTCTSIGGGDGGVLTCVPGRGFDLVISNVGGGSDDYSYTFTELDSGVSVSGTVSNPVDYFLMSPTLRFCNWHNATVGYASMAVMCVSSNF